MTTETPAEAGSHAIRNLALFIGGTLAALLVVGGAAALLKSSPTPFPGAETMPPGPIAYVQVDFSDHRIERLVDTFDEAGALGTGLGEMLADSGLSESLGLGTGLDTDVRAQLDGWLAENLGTDLDELRDIVDQVALGVYDVEFGPFLDTANASVIVAVEIPDGATDFVERTIAFIEAEHGVTFAEISYSGQTVYTADDIGGEPVSLSLSGSVLLIANDADLVAAAIDARSGESLADDADFSAVVSEMPSDRTVTAYVGTDALASLFEDLLSSPLSAGSVAGENDLLAGMGAVHGIGMSVVLEDDAMLADLVAVGDADDPNFAPSEPLTASDLPDRLPADTIVYAGFGEMDLQVDWQAMRDEIAAAMDTPEMGNIAGLLDWIEFNAGVDFQEAFDLLTGEMAFGLFPADEGAIAATGGADLGFVAAAGVNDPAAMADTIESFMPMAQMLFDLEATEISDGLFGMPVDGGESVVIGVVGDYAVIASHEDHARIVQDGAAEPLSGSLIYQRTMGALPPGSVPIAYLDVTGLIGAVNAPDDVANALAPLQSAGASLQSRPGVSLMSVVVLIDY